MTQVHPIETSLRPVPARVVTVADRVEVELPSSARVAVRLAMAIGHTPMIGDELLVIGDEHGWYAIGVVSSQGEVRIEVPADVRVHAKGDLELVGDEGVHVSGKVVRITSESLKVAADSVKQTANRWVTRVRGLLSVNAGEKRDVVTGEHAVRADRATLTSRTVVTINGKEIHLG
jgi:hypothetical protein